MIPYSGKLLREKIFTNFEVLWLFVKVFIVKLGGMVSSGGIVGSTSEQPVKRFLRENFIFHQFVKVFSHKSFPLLVMPFGAMSCKNSHYASRKDETRGGGQV